MKTKITLSNEKGHPIYWLDIDGGFDLKSAVQMAIGRTLFEMGKEVDLNWETAQITVERKFYGQK